MLYFTLYLITDRHRTNGRPLAEVVEAALQAGAKAVQLREKDLSGKELFELARRMRELTNQYGARLFINGRLDIALAVEADGVHLGQKSFSANDVKQFLENASRITHHTSRLLIGVSTHSRAEAKKSEEEGADFITFGPIFYTPSKAEYGEPLGIEAIKNIKTEIKIPVFAIGGIKKENVKDVMQKGADGIAVISAVIAAEDAGKAVRELRGEQQ
ncbi:MAG: thiamine phosphate synthase [Deltaproteobacteria bacterium]|nr:thiamine phosphate synthase [Deltaproteobacteria bacterium]